MRAKFINESSSKEFLEDYYNIWELDNGDIMVQIKSKHDFPYRIRPKNGEFILSQAFSPRAHIKPTFHKIKAFSNLDDAYDHIIKRHNKNVKYIPGLARIYSKSDFKKEFRKNL